MNAPPLQVFDGTNRDRLGPRAWKVMFRELFDYRELIQRLTIRNFSAQFRQSFLGYLWVAFPPLATTFVFSMLKSAGIMNIPVDESGMPYPLYALVGVTVWSAFTLFTLSAVNSISGGGNLVSKVYFPREVLVLSSLGNALINTLIRLAVVLVTFALFRYAPQPTVLLVPLVFLPMIALALGIGMLLAPINTMMNDMAKVMEFLFTFGMFITPAIYRTPELGGGAWSDDVLYWVHTLNPVTHFIEAIRDLIDTGLITLSPGLVASSILSFLMLAIGWRFFHICEPLLAERL